MALSLIVPMSLHLLSSVDDIITLARAKQHAPLFMRPGAAPGGWGGVGRGVLRGGRTPQS